MEIKVYSGKTFIGIATVEKSWDGKKLDGQFNPNIGYDDIQEANQEVNSQAFNPANPSHEKTLEAIEALKLTIQKMDGTIIPTDSIFIIDNQHFLPFTELNITCVLNLG